MSQLEKLAILGVRSFSNTQSESIKFHTPLTLIVGLNGSGKTTIIECLKYATTGDLPPNTKGGAFIHDPSVCGEKEVLAQVKVMFKSTSQVRMVVTRSQQLTVKKNSRSTKTIESILHMSKNGEKATISSRAAELDLLMPQNLGVSKAILEYVIFCHQDDSLWPLSEPLTLKKKFDEIFEAQKYTKAIANIKDIRKEQGQRLTTLKQQEQQAKENKAKADKAEKASRKLASEIDVLRTEIAETKTKFKEAQEKAKIAWDEVFKYKNVLDSLNLSREKFSFHQATVDKLKKNLQKRDESDDSLRSELENYANRVKSRVGHQDQLKKQYAELTTELQAAREKYQNKYVESGRYQNAEIEQKNRTEKRKSIIRDCSRLYSIRGFENKLSDVEIHEFMEKIMKLSRERQNLVDKARKDTAREIGAAQETLNKLSGQQSTFVAEKNASKQQIYMNDQKAKVYRSEVSGMSFDEGELAVIETRIEDINKDLVSAREESRAATWDQKIQAHDSRLHVLKDKVKQLNDELIESTKHAGDLAQQDHLHKELNCRQKSLEKLKNVHHDKLKNLLNHVWQPSSLEKDFERARTEQAGRVGDADRQRTSISRELDQTDADLARAQKSLDKGRREAAACEKRLRDILEGEPDAYSDELAQMQKERDDLKSAVEGYGHVRGYYQKAIAMAQSKHKCTLCTRAFQDDKQTEEFVKFMKKKLEKDDQLKEDKKSLADLEELLGRAREVGPAYDTWVRLTKTELPDLEKSEKAIGSKRSAVIQKLEEHDRIINELEQAKADVDSAAKAVANITRYHDEIISLSTQISEIMKKQHDSDHPRALEEIREQLDAANDEATNEVKAKEKLAAARDESRTKINDMELQLRDTEKQLEKMQYSLREKESKTKQISELGADSQNQRENLHRIDAQLQELSPRLEAMQVQLEEIRSRGDEKEKSLRDDASQLSESIHRLAEAEDAIRKYHEEGGSANLGRCQREIDNLSQEIKRIEEERNNLTKSVNRVMEELRNQEETKRIIRDNLDYRSSLRELEALQQGIAGLESQNAEADRDHWQAEATKWQNLHNTYSASISSSVGTARAKDDELKRHLQDWDTDHKDADKLAKEAHIKVEATKAAIEDLGKYASALDMAIMKYHSIKMEEINRIIEELWSKTYQGTDVDRILIRSDNAAGGSNRSYNYRVCMIKQDAEMDMRGRCSAGQKVLASIIIRLALAECFGITCGLIALDEPTTNLDQDNISALARSLHDLIQARRHQANFQLIVITHDEEFLRQMKCPDFCDYYYRVGRNEREQSIIMRQNISDVM